MDIEADLPPPSTGNVITILSIDGGGVRGIIPAILLMHLEAELQTISGNQNARIADFFDVIAGTSTGGLITAMLTAPDDNHRPLFTAQRIRDFYKDEVIKIFPPRSYWSKFTSYLYNPKYDGKYLHQTIRENLKETKLSHTLKNVVIPSFDMREIRPTIFSNFKIVANPSLDVKLSDICIGTSAAPSYLPPHYFENETPLDGKAEFNLVDGGVIANNPALLAISEVTQQIQYGNPDFSGYEINDYKKIFLVSFGTGFRKPNAEYDARKAAHWGILRWAAPSIEFALDGSQDLVDYHLASVFQALGEKDGKNYLRIQTDELVGQMAELDCALKANMDNLEFYVEQNLLNQTIKKINLNTFKLETVPGGPKNREAIKSAAEFLVRERAARMESSKARI